MIDPVILKKFIGSILLPGNNDKMLTMVFLQVVNEIPEQMHVGRMADIDQDVRMAPIPSAPLLGLIGLYGPIGLIDRYSDIKKILNDVLKDGRMKQ